MLLYLFTPWTAINLVDFYLVRKGHYSVREIFNADGMYGRWNWRGLLAYGAGFARAIDAIFAQWGTQLIGVIPGRTSEQVGGSKAGVLVRLTLDDVERLSNTVPGLSRITPELSKDVPVQNELHTYTWTVNGNRPSAS